MIYRRISDWDDAYANSIHIGGGERWPDAWLEPAQRARAQLSALGRAALDLPYGAAPRQRFDLFKPAAVAKGLVVFLHGGYWSEDLDKSSSSHLALGPLAHGYAVAIPSYTLCPDSSMAGIAVQIGDAISAAARIVDGPIHLTGHSAGGHLATRMATITAPLAAAERARLRNIVSISGLHDLRPLRATAINAALRMDATEAANESPALLPPLGHIRLTTWVGGSERAEFRRQSALLANIWTGFGVSTASVIEPDRHHFNIVDGLADPDHPLTAALLDAG